MKRADSGDGLLGAGPAVRGMSPSFLRKDLGGTSQHPPRMPIIIGSLTEGWLVKFHYFQNGVYLCELWCFVQFSFPHLP